MNVQTNPVREQRLQEITHRFRYPSTPNVAGTVMKRLHRGDKSKAQLRSAWVVTGLLILVLAVLFAVPSVRAEIIRFFQVGVVRIFPIDTTQTAIPSTTTLAPSLESTRTPRGISTPFSFQPEPLYTITTSGLAGETTLADAQDSLLFPIQLPTYPPDLDTPERVFLQEDGGMVILVWTEPTDNESARLSLHEIAPGKVVLSKYEPHVIQETQVDGNYAVWVQGPYLVRLTSGSYDFRRMVEGNTLIWEEEDITYRLESDLTLEETIRIAESLR